MTKLHGVLRRLAEGNTYFRRGHNNWSGFVLSMLAVYPFATVFYNWLVINYSWALPLMPDFIVFAVYAVAVYFVGNIVLGYFDMKRGTWRVDQRIVVMNTPYFTDIAEGLMLLCDGKPAEAKNFFEKWVKKK